MKFTKKTMAYILIALAAVGGIIYLLLKGNAPGGVLGTASANGGSTDPRGSWAQADDIAYKQMLSIGKSIDPDALGAEKWVDINANDIYKAPNQVYTIDLIPSKAGAYLSSIDSGYYPYDYSKMTEAQHNQLWQIFNTFRAKYANVIY